MTEADSRAGEDGCLDAGPLQASVGRDPIQEAVGAFAGFAEEDGPRLCRRPKLLQQDALQFEHLGVLIASVLCHRPQLGFVL